MDEATPLSLERMHRCGLPPSGLPLLDGPEQQLVRVEANFLRLPLFALDNKNLRTMDGIRCEGTLRRGSQSFRFTYRVTRNARTLYPGPLARSAHFALLSLATSRGFPITNPLVFGWRQLTALMGVQPSGTTFAHIREALTATKGLMIESQRALFSKAENKPLSTEDHGHVMGLYDELEFYGAQRPDGSVVDVNAVWFSRWYLDNLNALYTGPLDFVLWRTLNEASPIASRLYEFLFFKFYSGVEFLRFNYATLVKFIPARVERYLSDAKKQLQPALNLLITHRILRDAQWLASKQGSLQLLLCRGHGLESNAREPLGYELDDEVFAIQKVEQVSLPEEAIVKEFHRLWGHDSYTPQKGERETARTFLDRLGEARLKQMLPQAVQRMKVRFPAAKTFGAAQRFIEEIVEEQDKRRRTDERMRQDEQARETERAKETKKLQEQAVLKAAWDSLSEDERCAIRTRVLAAQPGSLKKFPGTVERLCLQELSTRFGV